MKVVVTVTVADATVVDGIAVKVAVTVTVADATAVTTVVIVVANVVASVVKVVATV